MYTTKQIENKTKQYLIYILDISQYLIFYKIMGYPVPTEFHNFLYDVPKKYNSYYNANNTDRQSLSRTTTNEYMEEYINYINKFSRLYKSLPFIKTIYLCNSISFNALHNNSDIDLFIVTNNNAIRRARFFSVLLFFFIGAKRSLKNKSMKFCLSFYVTEKNQNLYNISLPQGDVYLAYRLSHLIPLYHNTNHLPNIYKHNQRYKSLLPNHPTKHIINIGSQTFYGRSITKRILEFFF